MNWWNVGLEWFKLPVPHAGMACRTSGQLGAPSLPVRCQETPGSSREGRVSEQRTASQEMGQEQGAAKH